MILKQNLKLILILFITIVLNFEISLDIINNIDRLHRLYFLFTQVNFQ